jgi:hypothetical protein
LRRGFSREAEVVHNRYHKYSKAIEADWACEFEDRICSVSRILVFTEDPTPVQTRMTASLPFSPLQVCNHSLSTTSGPRGGSHDASDRGNAFLETQGLGTADSDDQSSSDSLFRASCLLAANPVKRCTNLRDEDPTESTSERDERTTFATVSLPCPPGEHHCKSVSGSGSSDNDILLREKDGFGATIAAGVLHPQKSPFRGRVLHFPDDVDVEYSDNCHSGDASNDEEFPDADDPQENGGATDFLLILNDAGPFDEENCDSCPVTVAPEESRHLGKFNNEGDSCDEDNRKDLLDQVVCEVTLAGDQPIGHQPRQSTHSRRPHTRSCRNQESDRVVESSTREVSYNLRSKTRNPSTANGSSATQAKPLPRTTQRKAKPLPATQKADDSKAKKVPRAGKYQKKGWRVFEMRRKAEHLPTMSPQRTGFPYNFPDDDGDWPDDFVWWHDPYYGTDVVALLSQFPGYYAKKFKDVHELEHWLIGQKRNEARKVERREAREAQEAMNAQQKQDEDDEETSE